MDWTIQDWGALGEIFGAIGVIFSLLYLARQLRRSDDTARAVSIQSVLDGFRDRIGSPAARDGSFADCFAHGLNSLEELSDTDKRRFFYIVTEIVLHMQNVLQLYERKLVTKEDNEAWLAYTASLLMTPGGADVWKLSKITIAPTIARALDDFIEQHPDTPSYLDLNPLMRCDETQSTTVAGEQISSYHEARTSPSD